MNYYGGNSQILCVFETEERVIPVLNQGRLSAMCNWNGSNKSTILPNTEVLLEFAPVVGQAHVICFNVLKDDRCWPQHCSSRLVVKVTSRKENGPFRCSVVIFVALYYYNFFLFQFLDRKFSLTFLKRLFIYLKISVIAIFFLFIY